MDRNGYISIHRKIQDNWLWNEKPFSKGQAWVDLILLARWKDGKQLHRGKLLERKRGQVCCSMSWLAKRWGWSRDKVRRFMHMLETQGMVTLDATRHDTSITIENYSVYQTSPTTDNTTDKATDKATDNTTDNTYKNKGNKGNKDNNPPISPQRGARGGRSRKPRNEVLEMIKEGIFDE